jgi:hypothetical protein
MGRVQKKIIDALRLYRFGLQTCGQCPPGFPGTKVAEEGLFRANWTSRQEIPAADAADALPQSERFCAARPKQGSESIGFPQAEVAHSPGFNLDSGQGKNIKTLNEEKHENA